MDVHSGWIPTHVFFIIFHVIVLLFVLLQHYVGFQTLRGWRKNDIQRMEKIKGAERAMATRALILLTALSHLVWDIDPFGLSGYYGTKGLFAITSVNGWGLTAVGIAVAETTARAAWKIPGCEEVVLSKYFQIDKTFHVQHIVNVLGSITIVILVMVFPKAWVWATRFFFQSTLILLIVCYEVYYLETFAYFLRNSSASSMATELEYKKRISRQIHQKAAVWGILGIIAFISFVINGVQQAVIGSQDLVLQDTEEYKFPVGVLLSTLALILFTWTIWVPVVRYMKGLSSTSRTKSGTGSRGSAPGSRTGGSAIRDETGEIEVVKV